MAQKPPEGLTTPRRFPGPPPYAVPHGTRYLLPCPVLGLGGLYEWCLCDVAQARRWLTSAPYINYVSHPFLREACETLLEVALGAAERGIIPPLGYADDALVFSIAGYEAPWALWRGNRARVREALDAELVTMGLLRRLT